MATHTPGPWIVFVDRTSDGPIFSVLPAGRLGEIVGNIKNGSDANLIAAAPQMFAALKATRIYVEILEKHLDPTIDPGAPTIREHAAMLRAAIALAEGNGSNPEDGK